MSTQTDFVQFQAEELDLLVGSFAIRFDAAAQLAETEVQQYFAKYDPDSGDGTQMLSQLPELFEKALTAVGVYGLIAGFVADAVSLGVEWANRSLALMRTLGSGFADRIPDLESAEEVLVAAGRLTHEVFEAHVDSARALLAKFSARALGGASKDDLRDAIAFAFAKLRRLGAIPLDSAMTLFRLSLRLLFDEMTEARREALFEYVGVRDERNRPFCAHLLDIGGKYRISEIEAMDNGHGLPVFENGGGNGCRHWWWAVRIVRMAA